MKILFFFLILSFLILNSSIAIAIEVGGHLTEDTTWSPVNNPYLVIDNIYVDAGVILTIQPGTEIMIQSAPLTSSDDYLNNFYYQNGTNEAKMFWVDGRIIAEGTEQDSITFTRLQDDFDYYWGCLFISENEDSSLENMSVFKYCKIKYSGSIGITGGNFARGAITIRTGYGYIQNCLFINNAQALSIGSSFTQSVEVSNCIFPNDNNINNYVQGLWGYLHLSIKRPDDDGKPALLVNNEFVDKRFSASSVYFVDNYNNTCMGFFTGSAQGNQKSIFYNNEFNNCVTGIEGGDNGDSLYIKNNRFIGGGDGIDIDDAYVEISDNYFDGCDVYTEYVTGKVYNNIINNGEVFIGVGMDFYNNVVTNYSGSNATFSAYDVHNLGNVFYNNENTFSNNNDNFHTNCVILESNDLFWWPTPNGTDTFRNCIIDFELEYPLIDGGENIWVDSVQAQLIFEDIQNGDFHLIEGSLAIDAGFDTLSYYYPFDMDYSIRVWDGDEDGTAIIDIGPYEYGAPQLGKITGNITETNNGEFVDYVLIKIDNEQGNFTFADSAGYFEIQLPNGTYDIYAERVFFEDNIIYSVTVDDEQTTEIAFNMTSTLPPVSINEEIIPNSSFQISNLTNYPNPFNPSTTISFSVQNNSNVELSIFNIKGQKIKTLINEQMQKGMHSIIWSGLDSNNKPVSSGIYLYKIKVGKQVLVNRMLLLK